MRMQSIPATTMIWSFQRRLTHRLMAWALSSMAVGAALLWIGHTPAARAAGMQALGWGAVDAAIALGGQSSAERKQGRAMPVDEIAHARTLRRLLWVNAGLDVLYVTGGLRLARARQGSARRGHGIGILIQGAFLLIFDLIHALRIPAVENPVERAPSGEAQL